MIKYIVPVTYTVKQTIEHMERENIKATVVVNDANEVLGVFANGDMRSYFLTGGSLGENISVAMNKKPVLYHSMNEIERERKKIKRVIYPIVNNNNILVDVMDYEAKNTDVVNDVLKDVPLVIMAGGKGTRLYPYTKILPKPLIPIGDVTITERIIDSFSRYGCKDVKMILNYKANMIKAYMQDLDKEYSIEFYEEKKFLGTAGGLKLLKKDIHNTFILSNCDVLIDADLECVYKTHKAKKNKITFICSMRDIVIPYGVIETDESGMIVNMKEKPELSYLINTGIYMIEPEVINEINSDEFIHLPDLAKRYMEKGEKVGVFPISEKSWLDMGQFSEMQNMLKSLEIQ